MQYMQIKHIVDADLKLNQALYDFLINIINISFIYV